MTDAGLQFESHLEGLEILYGHTPEQSQDSSVKRAQYRHALYVFSALVDLQIKAVKLSSKLNNKNASYYMLYGVARRLRMIWDAYRAIVFTASPQRTEPLSSKEASGLSRDINVIYMHLRGVLDNFAWCLVYEKEPHIISCIPRTAIGLFSNSLRKKTLKLAALWENVDRHRDWMKEVTERRDPVSHRIPIYIPHAIFSSQERERYLSVDQEYIELVKKMDFDEANILLKSLGDIGTFLPCFVHHPEDGAVPLYPTVPNDMGRLVTIYQIIETAIIAPK